MQRAAYQEREQRVAYATTAWLHPGDERQAFEARVINLSVSGVLVLSPRTCPVGTHLVCELPLPGGARRLPGRVTRLEAVPSEGVAVGIAFNGLAAPDEERLAAAVAEAGADADGGTPLVEVRFEGVREPLRSRALLTGDGIRLYASLPFLRLRSPVEVTFLSGETGVPSQGSVREVRFESMGEDGVPRVAVDVCLASVDLEEESSAPAPTTTLEEYHLSPGRGLAPAAEDGATIPDPLTALEPTDPVPAVVEAASVTGSGTRRRRRTLGAAAAILIGAGIGIAVGGGLALLRRGPTPRLAQATSHRRAVAPPGFTAQTPAAAADRMAGSAAPARLAAQPSPSPVAPPRPPALVMPTPLPEGTPGPTVETSGSETTALVPLSGSTDGMTHHSLLRPRGLSVNLPRAEAVLPVGVHRIERDGLRYVWIRDRPQGGLQIRFIFSAPPPDERLLELEEDAVRIRVRQHQPVAEVPAQPDLAADTALGRSVR